MAASPTDYYEFLQISPNAETDTIHRVYRFLAARLHPDNHETGDAENFQLLKQAYDVLSNPETRAEYDAKRQEEPVQPYSSTIDFMDSLDGELNRRVAVLVVLYYKRRTSPIFPDVTLAEIEERMGFPRDYLDFTMWYLTKKGYISKSDGAKYTLTAEGVDFVEEQRAKTPVLDKLLLTSGPGTPSTPAGRKSANNATAAAPANGNGTKSADAANNIELPSSTDRLKDRRSGLPDRRVGAPDLRAVKVERRVGLADRRGSVADRRSHE